MRAGKVMAVLATVLLAAAFAPGTGASAGPWVRTASMDGDGNTNIDLAVRQVTVTPVRAHVGDTVRVEMVIENKAEGTATTPAEVRANGKVVGRQLFTWGTSAGDRLYRLSFGWDTRGLLPGEYRIRAVAFVWEDSSEFDNELELKTPVVLVPPGAAFPDGQPAGGTATETDPRFGKMRPGG